MYVSRLAVYTVPGKTGEVERALGRLRNLVEAAGHLTARPPVPTGGEPLGRFV